MNAKHQQTNALYWKVSMPRVELVFFDGCPNVDLARNSIRSAGVSDFLEINQNKLAEAHPYRRFSSPSILVDGKILVGSENGGSSCSVLDWNQVSFLVRSATSAS